MTSRDMTSQEATSRGPTQDLPAPQIFTIFSLPSYDDAVKSSGDPPSYEQALTDRTEIPPSQTGATSLDRQWDLSLTVPAQNPARRRKRRQFMICFGLMVSVFLPLIFLLRYIFSSRYRY